MKTKIITLIISSVMTVAAALPAHAVTRICANTVTGDIQTRTRCRGQEITLNAHNIWDVLKGKNTYLSSCRTVENTDVASPSTAGASIRCNGNEFLLNYGDYTRPVALNVTRQNKIEYDGQVPVGVSVIAQNDFGVGDYSFTTHWTFHLTGTCCPRI
jgi:hypothetical protein